MYNAREKEREVCSEFSYDSREFNCSKEVDQEASSEWLDPTADPRDASQPKEEKLLVVPSGDATVQTVACCHHPIASHYTHDLHIRCAYAARAGSNEASERKRISLFALPCYCGGKESSG